MGTFWTKHPNFKNIVHHCWGNKTLCDALPYFRCKATEWNNLTFGEILRNKKRLLARLRGIKILIVILASFSRILKTLIKEYNDILKVEKDYWMLRSRIN